MRPDKKGNKRRDERRNGPKAGPQKPAGPPKPPGPGQKPPQPSQKPPATVQKCPAPGDQGPRVLEPAAPPPSDAARYRRREISSNWHRYEEEPDQLLPDEDYIRGDTFAELLAASAGDAGHFQLRSERTWLEAGGDGISSLLTLDARRTADVLNRLPLPERLGIDTHHFTEEELQQFTLETEVCAAPAPAPADPPAVSPAVSGTGGGSSSGPPPVPVGRDGPGAQQGPSGPTAPPSAGVSEVAPSVGAGLKSEEAACPAAPVRAPAAGPPAALVNPAEGGVSPSAEGPTAAAAESSRVTAESAPGLLQDDWLDSVLSDED